MSTMNPSAKQFDTSKQSARTASLFAWWRALPADWRQTWLFAGGAAICIALTVAFEFSSRPAEIAEYGRVGEQFYPEFVDPTLAKSLEVFVFDKDNVTVKDFAVKQADNGRWVIPSHHNYPADANDQLAETASSVIGIRRGAMVTRWPADHARYGVVDPNQSSLNVEEVEGVGSRVVLRADDESILADYIVGDKVDETSDEFYVRHPEEDEVYIAALDIDLSTRFTDWIDTDLLDVFSSDFRELTINDYSFDELKGTVTTSEVSTLSRESSSDSWKLTGLNEATEEVDKDAVRETLTALSDLTIKGVRPKQKGLTPDLTLDRSIVKSQSQVERIQGDLLARGFLLQQDKESGDLGLIAREGEIHAATDDGLVYRLHFGRAFTGSEEELETGLGSSDGNTVPNGGKESSYAADGNDSKSKEDPKPDVDTDESESGNDEGDSPADESGSDSSKPGRYVFVSVEFDEKHLKGLPEKPVRPEKPSELAAADANDEDNGNEAACDSSDHAKSESDKDAKSEQDETDGENESEDPLAEIRKEYEEALKEYEDDLKEYEDDVKDREQKVNDGKEKAEEYNRRFAEWYYVIPGDDFDKIRVSRSDIVKEKELEEEYSDNESDEESENVPVADESAADAQSTDIENVGSDSFSDAGEESVSTDDAASPEEDVARDDLSTTDEASPAAKEENPDDSTQSKPEETLGAQGSTSPEK